MATIVRPDIRLPDLGMRTQTAAEICPPACPACGGLECLCRPRFFAGQLLTDEDLRRLDRYIVEKSKLHNRHLHGSGVVCGLEVVCDACDSGNVRVRPGYALSPCGEDIVVCAEASVPVCELASQCREVQRAPDCDPPRPGTPETCREGIEKWVLAICYEETPSRGVAALRGDSGCGSGCKCGGTCGGSGSCSCGSKASKPAATSMPRKRTPPQCEPTLVCEGYRFKLYPAPKPSSTLTSSRDPLSVLTAQAASQGPLLGRMLECFLRMVEVRSVYHGQKYDTDLARQTAYSAYLAAVREFAAEHASHNCELLRTLEAIDSTRKVGFTSYVGLHAAAQPGAGAAALQDIPSRVAVLDGVVQELWRECLCSALLPPCPDPVDRDCVPLATVTLKRGDCRVIEICNWESREFAITLPNLYYWLSWVQWDRIKQAIAKLCCVPAKENVNLDMAGSVLSKVSLARQKAGEQMLRTMMFAGTAGATAAAGATSEAGAEASIDLKLDFNPRDAELGPMLAAAYRATLPDALNDWLLQFAGAPDKDTPPPSAADLKSLHERVAALEQRFGPPPDDAAKKRRK